MLENSGIFLESAVEIYGANPVDIVVLIVVLISGLLALVRGFVAEVLTITGLVLALAAALYGTPHLAPYVLPHLKGVVNGDEKLNLATSAVSGVLLFMGTIAVTSAISYVISRRIHKTNLSAIDRSLGFLFGLLRGGLLVSLLYICVTFVFPPPKNGEDPEPGSVQAVLKNARTGPALAAGARVITSFAPDKGLSLDDLTKAEPLQQLIQPKPEASKPGTDENRGYSGTARQGIEDVINRAESAAKP